ncbi:isoleucyl-tRNA synthase [Rhodonellum psychrophilum GCM71 = DSM 17998]|uniref:Isoleucine--tRNA ligase n=2 Tax=Rhodonellum TaxID=336827 RepID=U5C1S7_9BACT|nr:MULTISPECIES: isoleucine--tRNA ligase [Rhodonellum]ERM83769.1 isoleucyl-tRNA synthase [Rhodonellum psychrophilum GCM71 = DSM 17998]SDY64772.1 Isoleucyl-tRNA synthetase [Rhodonellum ikkaensis]
MKKYQEFKQVDYPEIGESVLQYWKENNIFAKSVENRQGAETFTFFEGPPSANGTPGIHHVMARTLKDVFCRYKTLQGFQVKRKGGWDTHGLPVELQVEKELGITKEDIGKKISVEEYNRKCRETVMRFKDEWDDLTEKIGYWVDLDDPYITFEPEYIESVWSLLKKLYEKQLIYKGYTIQPYSPAAGTGLSSHELNQPGCYRDVKDTSITAQFKVKGEENTYLLAWTTTPWTLPSNSALAIGEKLDYVKVKTFNPYNFAPASVILAKARMAAFFNPKASEISLSDYTPGDKLIPYEIVEEYKGAQLLGLEYEQLFPIDGLSLPYPAFTVISGDYVTTEDGSGIVHLAKAFGADDFRTLTQQNVPGLFVKDENGNEVPLVDKQGKFLPIVGEYLADKMKEHEIVAHKEYGVNDFYVKNYTNDDEQAKDFKSTDVIITIILKNENKAFKVEKYEHSYPHCWRTDKPILYYPMESWFIKTTAYKDRLVELNKTINWKPEATGTGRFGNWLENLVDWNLSRSRFWGTPLPIWRTEDGLEEKCIGSIAELNAEIAISVEKGFMAANPYAGKEIDLHRPFVDDVIMVSSKGEKMKRELDLIDVWFDSGAMPYAQWHYPFENEEIFKANYPADFIAEGVDQTRGWFFTLHTISVMLFDRVAFKNVIANGLVLDKNGNKMSKRLGNAVDPFKALKQYGPDALRWYMLSNANPWDNLKFNEEGVTEVQRRFFGTLQNTYNFFALYANLDHFIYQEDKKTAVTDRPELDQWIISKLQSLISEVESSMDNYDVTKATRTIMNFTVDHLSNWYVRLARKRFWRGEMNADKQAAYETLHECLMTLTQLMSSFAPFYSDWLFKNLTQGAKKSGQDIAESIHLSDWKSADQSLINADGEASMQMAQEISSLVHSLRKKEKLKVRQPLQKILIPVLSEKIKNQIQQVEDLILSEVNIKHIEYIDDTSGIVVKSVKPNFALLGKRFGPKLKAVSAIINAWGKEEISQIEKNGVLEMALEGETVSLTLEDVLISSQDIPGWSVASSDGLTVALDVTLTDELKQEGIARDLVNRIQNLRKDMGLEVQDKITIKIAKHDDLVNAALDNFALYIKTETQALSLEVNGTVSDAIQLDMDDFELSVKVEKA